MEAETLKIKVPATLESSKVPFLLEAPCYCVLQWQKERKKRDRYSFCKTTNPVHKDRESSLPLNTLVLGNFILA